MKGARTQPHRLWGGRGAPLPASERLTQLVNPSHPSNQPSPPWGSQCQGCLPSCCWISTGGGWQRSCLHSLLPPGCSGLCLRRQNKPLHCLPAKPQCNCPLVQLGAVSPECCFPPPPKLFAKAQLLFKRGDQSWVDSLCNTRAVVSPKLDSSKIPKKM